ncbi:XRE family transcriptional regulator [Snodgrassella sp. B3088]|uniref:XRE family transcriptional regulator n=1 Tax=Snodgrassella TaxID=1193515 RepID=UPI00226A1F86|nr:XRE family transcriptional regulator [Snodgrassella sp. B3088]MCX8748626.1 hypothetical protein [Snodgrassella sp. B3088]
MNWSTIIEDLQKAGYSQKDIANHCNCSQGAISQIKAKFSQTCVNKNKTVSFDLGNKLIALHKNVVEKNVCN